MSLASLIYGTTTRSSPSIDRGPASLAPRVGTALDMSSRGRPRSPAKASASNAETLAARKWRGCAAA